MAINLKKLARLKLAVATLEATVYAERAEALATLPHLYGFDSTISFITAVKAAAKGAPVAAIRPSTRRRARITAAVRARVKRLFASGNTAKRVAAKVGISVASANIIKRNAGLVHPRK
jgi:hypothetical protein